MPEQYRRTEFRKKKQIYWIWISWWTAGGGAELHTLGRNNLLWMRVDQFSLHIQLRRFHVGWCVHISASWWPCFLRYWFWVWRDNAWRHIYNGSSVFHHLYRKTLYGSSHMFSPLVATCLLKLKWVFYIFLTMPFPAFLTCFVEPGFCLLRVASGFAVYLLLCFKESVGR